MTAAPRTQVAYILTTVLYSSDDITSALTLQPTATWNMGDYVRGTQLIRRESGWMFKLPESLTFDVEGQVSVLLCILDSHKKSLRDVSQRLAVEAEISCVVYVTQQTPALHFCNTTLSRIGEYGACIDIDIILIEE